MEKHFFYIIKFLKHDYFKIGVSDVVYSRILKHHETYSIDFEKSYLIRSNNNKITSLFETEIIAYFSAYRDYSFKPRDGYTEIFKHDCLKQVVDEIKNRAKRFPHFNIEITEGINIPEDYFNRIIVLEGIIVDMKVYGYYPSGISTLYGSLSTLYDTIKKEESEDGLVHVNKLNLNFINDYLEICTMRLAKGLFLPFYYEWHILEKIRQLLDKIEEIIRLDIIGLEKLYIYSLGAMTMLSYFDDKGKLKPLKKVSVNKSEYHLMKRSGNPSRKFMEWQNYMDSTRSRVNLSDKYFSFTLYPDNY